MSDDKPHVKRTADLEILLLLIKAEIVLNPDKAIELIDELVEKLKP